MITLTLTFSEVLALIGITGIFAFTSHGDHAGMGICAAITAVGLIGKLVHSVDEL